MKVSQIFKKDKLKKMNDFVKCFEYKTNRFCKVYSSLKNKYLKNRT